MNIRKFKTDKEALLAEGQRIVKSSDDARYIRKVTIVNLVLSGANISKLSECCGETSRTLSSWVKSADEKGFESLRPVKQTGRPPKLTDIQKEEIKVAISEDPENYGYTVWDGPSLSAHIMNQYGVSLGVRQCQRLFRELGFSLIRPQTFPAKNEEKTAEREEFKKK